MFRCCQSEFDRFLFYFDFNFCHPPSIFPSFYLSFFICPSLSLSCIIYYTSSYIRTSFIHSSFIHTLSHIIIHHTSYFLHHSFFHYSIFLFSVRFTSTFFFLCCLTFSPYSEMIWKWRFWVFALHAKSSPSAFMLSQGRPLKWSKGFLSWKSEICSYNKKIIVLIFNLL